MSKYHKGSYCPYGFEGCTKSECVVATCEIYAKATKTPIWGTEVRIDGDGNYYPSEAIVGYTFREKKTG